MFQRIASIQKLYKFWVIVGFYFLACTQSRRSRWIPVKPHSAHRGYEIILEWCAYVSGLDVYAHCFVGIELRIPLLSNGP